MNSWFHWCCPLCFGQPPPADFVPVTSQIGFGFPKLACNRKWNGLASPDASILAFIPVYGNLIQSLACLIGNSRFALHAEDANPADYSLSAGRWLIEPKPSGVSAGERPKQLPLQVWPKMSQLKCQR
jgi:hypothetical protein